MAKKDSTAPPARVRFRRTVTVDGETYPANTTATVPATDELWKAVNVGEADLDPAPGEPLGDGTQPFPPKWVTEAPTPPSPPGAAASGPDPHGNKAAEPAAHEPAHKPAAHAHDKK